MKNLFLLKIFTSLFVLVLSLAVSRSNIAAEGDDLYNQAFNYWQQKQWDNAISAFENFISKYPKAAQRNEAELRLADSYFRRGNFVNMADSVKGREHLDYILKQGKNTPVYKEASLHYAFSLYSLMNFVEAKPRLEEYIKEFPNDSSLQKAYYYLAMCESHLGNYNSAINYFNTCLSKFPEGELKAECQLDQAVAIGKSGRYAEADGLLNGLIAQPNYKLTSQAYLQRAHLQIDQKNYDTALQILDNFIQTYQNTQGMQAFVSEAYQYEAYCYIMQEKYDAALKVAEQIERLNGMNPEAALLKVKMLIRLERFEEAEAILKQLENTKFGLYAADVLTYYKAMVQVARGNWTETINILNRLMIVKPDPQNANSVLFGYYDVPSTTSNKLLPVDFLGAGGVLVCAYASRWAATHQYADDNTLQEQIYNALYKYAQSQKNNQSFLTIMTKIDTERKKALANPVMPGRGTAFGMNESVGQLKPINTENGTGGINYPGTSTIPNVGNNTNLPNSFPGQSGYNTNGGFNNIPDYNNRPQNPSGTGMGITNGFGEPVQSNSFNPGNQNSTAGTISNNNNNNNNRRVTLREANTTLDRAGECYINKDYERAERLLLAFRTKSVTFWEDCPTVAPQLVLLYSLVLKDERKYQEARLAWEELVKMAPGTPQATEASYYLGYYYDSLMARDKAIEYFEKVVNSSVSTDYRDDALYYLGMNEWERRNTSRAEDYFRIIYRNYPSGDFSGHAAWAIAKIEYDAMNFSEAEKIVNEELARNPDAAIIDWLLFLKGEIALRYEDYEKARIAYNLIITQFPNSPKRAEALGRLAMMPAAKNRAPASF